MLMVEKIILKLCIGNVQIFQFYIFFFFFSHKANMREIFMDFFMIMYALTTKHWEGWISKSMLDKKKMHAENKISSSDQFFLHEIQGLNVIGMELGIVS